LTGTDCEGAAIGRIAKTIVTIISDEGEDRPVLSVLCQSSLDELYLSRPLKTIVTIVDDDGQCLRANAS